MRLGFGTGELPVRALRGPGTVCKLVAGEEPALLMLADLSEQSKS